MKVQIGNGAIGAFGTTFLMVVATLVSFASSGFIPVAQATVCPTFTTTNGSAKYVVRIQGNDGSCIFPASYDGTGRAHVNFATGIVQNPYTITLVSCSGSSCPPSQIWIGGWGQGNVGSSPYSLPYSFLLDASVQAGKVCTTAPIKVTGNSGISIMQIEAGTSCVPTTCPVVTVTSITTVTPTVTATKTDTITSTATSTKTATVTSTATQTNTATSTTTATNTQTTTKTQTVTGTATQTFTTTVTVTITTTHTTTVTVGGPAPHLAPALVNPNWHTSSTTSHSSTITSVTCSHTGTSTVTSTVTKPTTTTVTQTHTIPTTTTVTQTSTVPVTKTVTTTIGTTTTATATQTVTQTVTVTQTMTVTIQTTSTTDTDTTITTTLRTSVPEFAIGLLPVFLLAIPLMILLRRRLLKSPVVTRF